MADVDAVVIGATGALVLALGAAVASGRLGLLANYDPRSVEDERRVGRTAGGSLGALALLTFGLAWGLGIGAARDWWWAGWGVMALAVAGAVAAVASGRE